MGTNKEIVAAMYASFSTGDVPAALGVMADGIEWTGADSYPLAGTFVGPQAVLENVLMRLGEIGDEFTVIPISSSPTETPWWCSVGVSGSTALPATRPR